MKPFLTSLVAIALGSVPSYGQIIDNFNTNDSGNYNTVLAYDGGGSGAAIFAINGSSQLQPTGGDSDTTIFLRNTGEFLSDTTFGQSVSLDIVNVANATSMTDLGAASIGFAPNLTPTPGTAGNYSTQAFELGILRVNGGYAIASSNTTVPQATIPVLADFSLGAITETITRLGDNSFSYTFTGPGIAAPLAGVFSVNGGVVVSGTNVYFGPDVFGGTTTGAQIVDNLMFTNVPEPATYAMMIGGIALLVLGVRRVASV